jgi:uncharacterized protein YhaN
VPAAPAELRRLAAELDDAATLDARHAQWMQRRDELEAKATETADLVSELLAERGVEVKGADLEAAFERYVEDCRRRTAVARRAGRRDDLEARLQSRRAAEDAHAQDMRARRTAERQLAAVGEEAGCRASLIEDLTPELRKWVAGQEELVEMSQHHEKTAARLDQALDGLTLEELESQLGELVASAGDPPDDESPLEDQSAQLRQLDERRRRCADRLAELTGQITAAEKHLLDVSQAIEAEAQAAAEVARLIALGEDLDWAGAILTAAQQKVHADIAPVLNESIRPRVPRITGGRYDDIRVHPATLELEAHEVDGEFRSATVLSHGTTEQLFLLLRLALAERLVTTDERAPIILDDVTVQCDSERTVACLELLHELSTAHQVVLFSQEDEVLRWAQSELSMPVDRLIQLSTKS